VAGGAFSRAPVAAIAGAFALEQQQSPRHDWARGSGSAVHLARIDHLSGHLFPLPTNQLLTNVQPAVKGSKLVPEWGRRAGG
jgi:hypothetical protein